MLARPLEAALKSGIFDEVYVSTDDEQIASIAKKYGGKVLLRKANLADDFTPTDEVIKDALSQIKAKLACCLYATAVLIDETILLKAYEHFVNEKAPFLFSASRFSFPIQRAFYLRADGRVQMFDENNYYKRSQDLQAAYQDAGAFYFGTFKAWMDGGVIFGPNSCIYELPSRLVCDIDTQEDLDFAKLLFRYKNAGV